MIFNTLEKPLFYDVEVLMKRKETDNSFTFQFAFIKKQIVTKLEFVPGQFNLLEIPGLGLYKSTITSNPNKTDFFEHTIHYAVKNSIEYKIIESLMEGTVIKAAGPFGNGWAKSSLQGKDLLVIAGGLGFRSIRPMLDYIEHRRVLFNEVEVLYAVKTPKDFLYSYEYERWKNAKIDMEFIVENAPYNSNTQYKKGLIVSLLKDMRISNEETMVLISGSEMMIKFTINFLFKKQFSEKQIYISLDYLLNKPDSNWVGLNGPVFSLEQIKSWLLQ
ncbi:hypothetical protein [Desulfitibacter alkalitolerans]|uniref:hypothetical protein n=1 Tax=Desulfitibacter alkalitolerans TaxID=264641 RepID=UPI000486B791|nr:hypothetical protein [Desulfitibacter alkalitolerans]